MLAQLFYSTDYVKTLHLRRVLALALLAVGVIGLVCYALLIHESCFLGGAGGSIIVAAFPLIRIQYLLTHPDARKTVKIQEQNERVQTIENQAYRFAGTFTFFCFAVALFILAAVNEIAAMTLLPVTGIYAVAWLARWLYLSKTL